MGLDIFAGPIVRRVSAESVYLWVATIDNPSLEATLFVNHQKIGTGFSTAISLNDRIYIHLIKITPFNGKFPTNQSISYSIGIVKGNGYDYEDFYNVVIDNRLAYNNGDFYDVATRIEKGLKGERPNLPTFIIPSESGKLNIVFGSCRKPHDEGKDAFVKIDALVAGTIQSPADRPHALYLGGDQIYADDVHDSVINAIRILSNKYALIEILPNGATHTISYPDRSQLVKRMGFTSGEIKNHLVSFGEYVMMYGLVWNGENWKGLASSSTPSDFLQALPETRRSLANIATYMIFDDHDVTDDWFITKNWKTAVLGNPNGKRVIANAMAAYFLFQGWGNAPHKFNYAEVKKVIEGRNQNPALFDSYFLNRDWEFETPTSPVSYFLDTRTNRGGDDFPPLLKATWANTKINVANKNMPFVLITPGPMVTFPGIDMAQETFVKAGNLKYELDYESWFANKDNYKYFFEYFRSNSISKIIVLSGDVHYGFSAIFSIFNKEKLLKLSGGFQIDCLQLTSSALKNSAKLPLGFSLGINATVPYTGVLYFLFFRNSFEIACDKGQAERKVLSNRTEKILNGSASTAFPTYAVENKEIYELSVTGPLPKDFSYIKLDPAKYPDLILELNIKSLSPKTADYIAEHNFGLVSIHQNAIEYAFNNASKYRHSL
jgi:hypothetical protein